MRGALEVARELTVPTLQRAPRPRAIRATLLRAPTLALELLNMKSATVLLTVVGLGAAALVEPGRALRHAGSQDTGTTSVRAAEDATAATLAPGGRVAAGSFQALEMLHLRAGGVLWAQIDEHTPDDFTVRRLDTGGVTTLPWSLLDPEQELAFKRRFGYVAIEVDEFTVDASVVPLMDGSELVGVIELETPDALHIKTETGLLVLPRERIAGAVTSTRVPARDIYSRQELYEERRAELAAELAGTGRASIDAHVELARFCERILDFVHAAEHYAAAIDLGSDDERLAGWLTAAERRAEAQSQVDMLDRVDRLRRQGSFPRAMELLAEFPDQWPASPIMDEWAAQKRRVESDREQEALRITRDRWFYWMNKAIRDAAKELSFEQAQNFAVEGLGVLILGQVTADVQEIWPEVSPAEVREMFDRRTGSRIRGATYGDGTFLLGKERATATLEEEEEEEAEPLSAMDQQRRELEERMDRYLESSRRGRSGGGSSAAIDPELFWANWSLSGRTAWITSYYAEFGSDLEFVRVTVAPHGDCAGTGYIEVISVNAGGGNARRLVPDPACGGVGVKRRVKYR